MYRALKFKVLGFIVSFCLLVACEENGGSEFTKVINSDVLPIEEIEEIVEEQIQEDISDVTAGEGSQDETTGNELVSDEVGEEENLYEEEAVEEEQVVFHFSELTGECLDEDGNPGLNLSVESECGDFSNQTVAEIDLSNKTLYGLNLKGSVIQNSKVKFKNIAQREMQVDDKTFFENSKNPFTKLFDQHLNQVEKQKNKIQKLKNKVLKNKQRIEQDKEKLKTVKKEKKKEKITKRVLATRDRIKELRLEKKIAHNKKRRHRVFAKYLYPFAKEEPAFTNITVKNKQSYQSLNNQFLQGPPSEELIKSEKFSVSIWFRTIENQNDKRILSLHHSSNPQSGLNFMLKKGKIINGYRDEDKKWKELVHEKDYFDNEWVHLVSTYDGEKLSFYVNGELASVVEDSWVGLGTYPMIVGSYEGKSRFFVGDIDELSVWSRKLGKNAIRKMYNKGQPTKLNRHQNFRKPSNWWRFGDKNSFKNGIYDDRIGKVKLVVKQK